MRQVIHRAAAAKALPPAEEFSLWESFGKMLSVEKPVMDGKLLADPMAQWKAFWMFPCRMAALITAVFFASFWERKELQFAGADSAGGDDSVTPVKPEGGN